MRRLLLPFLLAFAPLPALACQLVEYADVPISFVNDEPVIEVSIKGQTLHLLVDTGGEASILTPATERRVRAQYAYDAPMLLQGPNGMVPTAAVLVDQFTIGDITLQNQPFLIAAFAPQKAGETGIDGLLGESILNSYNIGLDFPHRRLQLFSKISCAGAMPYEGQFATLPFTLSKELAPLISFYINGKRLNGLVDSGDDMFTVPQGLLTESGINAEANDGTAPMITIGGLTNTVTLERFATLTVGGEMFGHSWLRVTPYDKLAKDQASIGESYLRTHQVYIDNEAQKIWLGTLIR